MSLAPGRDEKSVHADVPAGCRSIICKVVKWLNRCWADLPASRPVSSQAVVLPVSIECDTIAEGPVANVLEGNTFERSFFAGFFVLGGGEAMVMGMLSRQARLALGCGCHRSSCERKIRHGSIIWRSSCVRS